MLNKNSDEQITTRYRRPLPAAARNTRLHADCCYRGQVDTV